MTTVGVLNIIFGALGSLVFLLMILAAGFLTGGGGVIGGEEGAAMMAGGGILMLIGIAAFAINMMLFISGIGVLKVAPWGRNLCIAYGGLGVLIYGASLVSGDFSVPTVGALAYCVLLIGLFFKSDWKAAFCSTGMPAAAAPEEMSAAPEADDETREAA
jgi:hypothetical protein